MAKIRLVTKKGMSRGIPTSKPILSNRILMGRMNGSVTRARKVWMAPSSIGKKLSTALANMASMTADRINRIVKTVRAKIISMVKTFLRKKNITAV